MGRCPLQGQRRRENTLARKTALGPGLGSPHTALITRTIRAGIYRVVTLWHLLATSVLSHDYPSVLETLGPPPTPATTVTFSKCKSPLIKNDPGEDCGWLPTSQTDPSLHHVLTLETHIPPVDYFFAKTKSKADHALKETQEFPGYPVVRTWCFHCQGPGSIPSRGTNNPQAFAALPRKKKKKTQQT